MSPSTSPSALTGKQRGCLEATAITFVLAGGWLLSLHAGLAYPNLGVLAALGAQILTFAFLRSVPDGKGAFGGLLLFIGVFALIEVREGRGRASEWLAPMVVILGSLTALRLATRIYRAKGSRIQRRLTWGSAFLVPLLVLLASYSGASGGAGEMSSWFSWLPPKVAEGAVIAIRKAIHSTYYPLLTLSVLAAFTRVHRDLRANAPWALGFAAIFACFDELRQSTVPTRSGSAVDVAIDLVASAAVLLIVIKRFHPLPDDPKPDDAAPDAPQSAL